MLMRLIRSRAGQSTAEYAVLFAIVVGAAIAMQQYVKGRLQGAVKKYADDYATKAGGGTAITPFAGDSSRSSHSKSGSTIDMTTAKAGTVKLSTDSNTTQTK